MAILFSLPHSPDEDSPAAGRRPQTPSDGFLRMGYKGIYIYIGVIAIIFGEGRMALVGQSVILHN